MSKKTLEHIKEHTLLDFLIQVKLNARTLYKHIVAFTSTEQAISTYSTLDEKHGRIEHREISLFASDKTTPKNWKYIKRFIKVHSWGIREGKPYDYNHYYILSAEIEKSKDAASGVRGHWGIENLLHRYKDVNLGEDAMTITCHHEASVIGILNTLAINILRLAGYEPTKDNIAIFANKVNELNILCRFKTFF